MSSARQTGVLLLARYSIKVVKLNTTKTEALDSLHVQATVKNKYILLLIYRHEIGNENCTRFYDEVENVIKNRTAVICGDFNSASINWPALNGATEGMRLIKFEEETFRHQTVQTPARQNNILRFTFLRAKISFMPARSANPCYQICTEYSSKSAK